jgi:glycosyltransferase involved in cell wall biosynthesis
MLGRHEGFVPSQGEKLAELFIGMGYPVYAVSTALNRYVRLADIIKTLVVKGRHIDVLVIHIYSGPSFVVEDIASWIGRRFNVPIVMSLHGGAMPEFMAHFPRWSKRVLGRADILVAQSEYLSRSIVPYGFNAEIIPNVINFPSYPHKTRSKVKPRLLWMRAFHPLYNPEMAIRVLAHLKARLPEASLVMAGQDNGLQADMQRLATELGVHEAVRFPGFLKFEDKIREGGSADIFINTPHIDNRPVCVVEACAMGLPVVSTGVGGVPDLLTQEETGLLVPDGDVKAMADAVVRLINDEDLARRLSENGPRLAESSSPDNVSHKWRSVFARATGLRKNVQGVVR